jgi:hypothetical protein
MYTDAFYFGLFLNLFLHACDPVFMGGKYNGSIVTALINISDSFAYYRLLFSCLFLGRGAGGGGRGEGWEGEGGEGEGEGRCRQK